MIKLLQEHWISWTGAPKEVILDSAQTNLGEPMVVPAESGGIQIRTGVVKRGIKVPWFWDDIGMVQQCMVMGRHATQEEKTLISSPRLRC